MHKILCASKFENLTAVSKNISEKIFHLLSVWKMPPCIVGGYLPFEGEIPLDPLWALFLHSGFSLSLPVVQEQRQSLEHPLGVPQGAPLVFAKWALGDPLTDGAFGTKIPSQIELVRPSVLLVPLVSFDEKGYRLGRGGGFYDATIQLLKPSGVQTIGIGFDVQKERCLPREPHDQSLDAIVTEKQVYVWSN